MFIYLREGRSNAHIKGDYQRIGDVMLKSFQGLKVRSDLAYTIQSDRNKQILTSSAFSAAPDVQPAQAVRGAAGAGEGVQVVPQAGDSVPGV